MLSTKVVRTRRDSYLDERCLRNDASCFVELRHTANLRMAAFGGAAGRYAPADYAVYVGRNESPVN